MTAYPGQTWTMLDQLCAALWDSQSRPDVIQPGYQTVYHGKILEEYGSGEAFSTDDYFRVNGKMVGFHKKYLQEAHEWNRNRVLQAIRGKVHPIVIDNTNMYKWEMWPYVRMAFRRGYWIEFEDLPVIPLEILNSWCPQIPMEVLERMNEGYEPVKKIWDVIYDYKSRGWWMPSPERLQNHW